MRSICLVLAIAAAAVAASNSVSSSQGRAFNVTVRGTIEQTGDYKQQTPQGECPYVYTGHWNNKLAFHSQRPTRLVFTNRSGRFRFAPSLVSAIAGTQTTRGAGVAEAPGCQTVVSDCFIRPDSFRGGSVVLTSPRRGAVALGRLRHPQLRAPCGNPERLGGSTASTDHGTARIRPNALATTRRPVVVNGSDESIQDLGPPKVDSGRIETRVSWTLTFAPVLR